jgi:hypothetical protein
MLVRFQAEFQMTNVLTRKQVLDSMYFIVFSVRL